MKLADTPDLRCERGPRSFPRKKARLADTPDLRCERETTTDTIFQNLKFARTLAYHKGGLRCGSWG